MEARHHDPTTNPTARIAAARLAIIESNQLKAELLHSYCATQWGFEVVALERTGGDGAAAVQRTQPDLVLASIPPQATDCGLAEFIACLRRAAPSAKLILLTAQCDEYLLHTIGAAEYHGLLYEADEGLESLAGAIARVRRGIRTVSTRIAQCQAALRASSAAFPKLLSRREQEVLVCIAHSLSDEEIARQLGTMAGTALSHRKKIMGKLGIHSAPKLIRNCLEKGFGNARLPTSVRGAGRWPERQTPAPVAISPAPS